MVVFDGRVEKVCALSPTVSATTTVAAPAASQTASVAPATVAASAASQTPFVAPTPSAAASQSSMAAVSSASVAVVPSIQPTTGAPTKKSK